MKTGATYWDHVSRTLQQEQPYRLWRRHSDTVDSRLLARWLPAKKNGRILKTDMYNESLGAGIRLPRRAVGWNVVGMDIAAEMLKTARRVGGHQLLVATDVTKLAFAENSFDAIFSNSTLDHFPSADQITSSLDECYRILKPGGRLILTMDNPLNPVLALRQALPHWLLVKLHITTFYYGKTFSPGRLKRALIDAGFKILNVEMIMHCPRLPAILASRIVDRRASEKTKATFLELIARFEKMSRFPTRFITGYFSAVCCQKCDRLYELTGALLCPIHETSRPQERAYLHATPSVRKPDSGAVDATDIRGGR